MGAGKALLEDGEIVRDWKTGPKDRDVKDDGTEATADKHEGDPIGYGLLTAFYNVFEWAFVLVSLRDLILEKNVDE